MSRLTLAIDQGSHASKVMVADADSSVLALAQQPLALQQPQPGWAEHQPSQLLASITMGLEQVAAELGPRVSEVAIAGLATQRASALCWQRGDGQTLSPVLSWRDLRALEWMPLDDRSIRQLSGLHPSPHYGACKLRWCLENLPAVQQAAGLDQLMSGPLSSWLSASLGQTTDWAVDPCNAQRTQLWALEQGTWSPALKQLYELETLPLPRLQANEADWGTISLGDHKVPLRIVTGDQQAALFAHGLPDLETIYVNLGTGAFVQRLVTQANQVPEQLLVSVAHQDAKRTIYTAEGTVNGCGHAIDWLQQQRGDLPHAAMALREVPTPPLFINSVGGLGSPFWKTDVEPQLIGATSTTEALAAVVESIAFLVQRNIELMPASRGIVVSGGLSRVDGLCQRIASLSGLSVLRYRQVEATAAGLSRMLSAGEADASLPESAFEAQFDGALVARYRRWCELMPEPF